MRFKAAAVALLALAGGVFAAPASNATGPPSMAVHLSQAGNTKVRAGLTNTGHDEFSFVHLNFFRHEAPVKKVSVFRDGRELEFKGIHASFRPHDLDDSEITTLAPGQSVEDVIDVADTVDLSEGGRGYIQSNGFVHLVMEHRVWEKIPFASNVLTMSIDPYEASKVPMAYDQHLARRTDFKSETCNDSQISIIRTGLQKAGELCHVAADAAAHGPEKHFKKFFTNTDSKTREAVAQRFRKISVEALSTDHGKSFLHCGDTHNFCKGSIVAYTWHSADETVVPCTSFFSEPVFDKSCVQSTTSGIMLHELSHVKGVLDPATKDHAYGFHEAQKLSAAEQFTNADNYAYFSSYAHQKFKCSD